MSQALETPTNQVTANPYAPPRPSALPTQANAESFDTVHQFKVLRLADSIKSAHMTAIAIAIGLGPLLLMRFVAVNTDISAGLFILSMLILPIAGLMFLVSYFSIACRLNGLLFGICVFCASFLVPFVPIAMYLFHYYQARRITNSAGLKFGLVGATRESVKQFRNSNEPKLDFGFPIDAPVESVAIVEAR